MVGSKRVKGFALLEVFLAVIAIGIITMSVLDKIADYYQNQLISKQAKNIAEIANAVTRYQASAGDPAIPLLSPHEQWNVTGTAFQNGATYVGVDWLKDSSCSTGTGAPFALLDCSYSDVAPLGDASTYTFTVSNDGTNIITTLRLVDANDNTSGILIDGAQDLVISSMVANEAESRVSFDGNGSSTSFFTVDPTSSIVEIKIGLDIANTPYLRRDGAVTSTGTQVFENGAGIKGAQNVSSERFSAYDTATGTESTTRYVEPDAMSNIEDLTAEEIEARNINVTNNLTTVRLEAEDAFIEDAEIDNLDVESFRQTDSSLSNNIAGELTVGTSDEIILSNGELRLAGQVVDTDDTTYFLKPSNTSRLNDISVGSRGNHLLSTLLPNYVLKGVQQVRANDNVSLPDCQTASSSPRIIIVPKTWTTYFMDNGQAYINNNLNYFSAELNATTWTILMKTHDPRTQSVMDDPNGAALAQIYCYYP